jgi:hypothetical protein
VDHGCDLDLGEFGALHLGLVQVDDAPHLHVIPRVLSMCRPAIRRWLPASTAGTPLVIVPPLWAEVQDQGNRRSLGTVGAPRFGSNDEAGEASAKSAERSR